MDLLASKTPHIPRTRMARRHFRMMTYLTHSTNMKDFFLTSNSALLSSPPPVFGEGPGVGSMLCSLISSASSFTYPSKGSGAGVNDLLWSVKPNPKCHHLCKASDKRNPNHFKTAYQDNPCYRPVTREFR